MPETETILRRIRPCSVFFLEKSRVQTERRFSSGIYTQQPNTTAYDAANRITQDSNFTYTSDANGNLTSRINRATGETTHYAYDTVDRLIRVDGSTYTISTYKYDAIGRRIERLVGTKIYRYLYDGASILATLDENNNLIQLFTNGLEINEPLSLDETGTDYYYHQDTLGSIVALTSSSGTTVETVGYEAYGNAVVNDAKGSTYQTSTVGNPLLFAGAEFDAESQLHRMGHRYYGSWFGSFLQEDPLLSINQFAYAANNPIKWTDPEGLTYESRGSARFRRKIRLGLRRLKKSKRGRRLCKFLELSHTHYVFQETSRRDRALGYDDFFNPNDNTINIVLDYFPNLATTAGPLPIPLEVILGHEIGHAAGGLDEGPNDLENVNDNENPIRRDLGLPERTEY